jgi:hypothetical protein
MTTSKRIVDKADWIAQFVAELVVRAKPPMPEKFAKTLAAHQWPPKGDRAPAIVAREWLKARPKPAKE